MGHGEPFTVPDYKLYRWQDYPELVQHQKRLAQFKLKDPWARNYAWLYDRRHKVVAHGKWGILGRVAFSGFWYGLAGAIAIWVYELAYENKKVERSYDKDEFMKPTMAHH